MIRQTRPDFAELNVFLGQHILFVYIYIYIYIYIDHFSIPKPNLNYE